MMTYFKAQPKEQLSDLTLANIEALAVGDEHNGDCDNYNGYRRIKQGNERIYDCCYVVVIEQGKEDCKGW